ncbi:hypothetical protein OU5_2628 [Pseudomonas mandelii JR-1]|uniref:Uncharacterized protein n=1 Tax=Pseudomonas mandelii JR-1 TaxID=1147786 RepID=A0A024EA85_9PSED|nr:hypothetical protein OU5_2628 [Pseudomonas mandelii JR-1]
MALGELVFLRNSWAMSGIGPTPVQGKTTIQIKLEAGSLPCASGKPTGARQTTNL